MIVGARTLRLRRRLARVGQGSPGAFVRAMAPASSGPPVGVGLLGRCSLVLLSSSSPAERPATDHGRDSRQSPAKPAPGRAWAGLCG
jgi:hypothetical protein